MQTVYNHPKGSNIIIDISNYDDPERRLDGIGQIAEPSKDDTMIELRSYALRPSSTIDSGLETFSNTANDCHPKFSNLEIKFPPNRTVSLSALDLAKESTSSSVNNGNLHQLSVGSTPLGSFANLSPRPLRRAVSVRSVGDFNQPSPSFLRQKRTVIPSSAGFDSISANNVPIENIELTQKEKTRILKTNLSKLLSTIYAMFLMMFGAIVYISDKHHGERKVADIYSITIAVLGMIWLIVLHMDLCIYKKQVLRQLKEREDAMQEQMERFSTATEFIFNSGFDLVTSGNESQESRILKAPPYRFLQGRHSGSFFLKIGMAAFCFGYLIHQGLQLGQHILNFIDNEKKYWNCSQTSSVVLHTILPLHAFYQLFITFKYSNIVIHRHKIIARFGLMHLIATCLCFWFSIIVEEAVEDYRHKSFNVTANETDSDLNFGDFHIILQKSGIWPNSYQCQKANSILSTRSLSAMPYLYPFAIEYNIILAGVWFIVWQNIGQEHHSSDPHHIHHTISQDETDGGEISYQSNLTINADCHAANKGLFVGLFILLLTVVTVIVFFVAMTTEGFKERAVSIHTSQEGILTFMGLFSVTFSMVQMNKLDVNRHPITFLDDVLLFVPLPFYFLHGIMSVMAEYYYKNFTRLAVHILVTIEVIVQTAFIIDGLRRCSNSQALRYKKLGREIVTFLIILNIALWIVNTFELKSVEAYHGQEEYFGDFLWMFIGHTTLPLMLFYRFHSSVCLADIWKSAYEKEA